MDKNKKIVLVGTLTLVIGFILGLFVSHMLMCREIAALEGALMAATGTQNGSSMTTITATTTDGSMTTAAAASLIEVSQIKVRVNDGAVQWFDGTYWNEVAPVEELQQQDKFYLAEESLAAFEQQYTEAALASAENDTDTATEYTDLNVGKIKKDPPITTTQPPQTNTSSTGDTTGGGSTGENSGGSTGENSGGSTGGSSSNGSSGGTTTTPSTGTTTPTTPSTPTETPSTPVETPSTPAETPSDSNTGDGENMEWSDDYL